jgi:hypothetical protein
MASTVPITRGSSGEEAHDGDLQQRRVDGGLAVGLRERVAFGVVSLRAHLGVDGVAQRTQAIELHVGRSGLLDPADVSVDRHPGHDLRMDEVSPLPADLPDALVGLDPATLEMPDEVRLQGPRVPFELEPVEPAPAEGVHDLAVHVDLKLVGRGVADTDRVRPVVTG